MDDNPLFDSPCDMEFGFDDNSTKMTEEIRAQSYVGFDSITQQIEHKLLKRGFQFNVILVGESPFPSRTAGAFGIGGEADSVTRREGCLGLVVGVVCWRVVADPSSVFPGPLLCFEF